MDKKRWEFSNIDQLNTSVNYVLRATMLNERCQRWQKVIESYLQMLWMIDTKNLPQEYEPPSSYHMFLYEIYYHLGVAYQHIGRHRKAIKEYTNAIEMVSAPKNGCLAGCVTNTCLMTPLYTRRAFAYSKIGDHFASKRDSEKAVVLDSKNPDVYCVRAMVESTADNQHLALQDINKAIELRPDHQCALLLKKNLSQSLIKSDPMSESYLRVSNFRHPKVVEFYDKLLFPLTIPHTITQMDLTPDKPIASKNVVKENCSEDGSRPSSSQSIHSEPFRCGTPTSGEYKEAAKRRIDYGNALRKHLSRPKTAAEFFALLERDRKIKTLREEYANRRAVTAMASFKSSSSHSNTPNGYRNRTPAATSTTTQAPPNDDYTEIAVKQNGNGHSLSSTKFSLRTPKTYTIQVFQDMNIKKAPRMYYKPWKGDRLPVAELKKRVSVPVFK